MSSKGIIKSETNKPQTRMHVTNKLAPTLYKDLKESTNQKGQPTQQKKRTEGLNRQIRQ